MINANLVVGELERINDVCRNCKHWVTIKYGSYEYPYCKKINSDSAVFRIQRCNGEFKDER